MLRGHHADHDLRGVEREVQIAGRFDRFRQDEPRQEAFIDSAFCDALANFQFVGPEPDMVPDTVRDMVCPFASQDDCQAGAQAPAPMTAMRLICGLLLTFLTLFLTLFLTSIPFHWRDGRCFGGASR